jgi:hypothetical protein
MKDRQYNGQKKDRQYNGQKEDRQYNGQKKDRQYNGQKKDRQYNGQKKDRQYNGQKKGFKMMKKTLHDNVENTTEKTKDGATRTQLKTTTANVCALEG